MKPFVIIGGAGYVGIQLVNTLLSQGCENITVVTRNTAKKILFRDPRVNIVESINQVKTKSIVINLAFTNSTNYMAIERSTKELVKSIRTYNNSIGAIFLLHVSTIVLTEDGLEYGKVSKKEPYIFSKSLQESLFISSFSKSELAIIRAGNILSSNSPWISKIVTKLINNEPIKFKGSMAPSNATSLDFLTRKIIETAILHKSGYFNCSELHQYSWDLFVDYCAELLSLNEIFEFDESIAKPQSFSKTVIKSLVQLGIAINKSPWHGDLLNRLVGLQWVPISKDKIRRSTKFQNITRTNISLKTGKEFKLFCDSVSVKSDFHADYTLEELKVVIKKGLVDMGYI